MACTFVIFGASGDLTKRKLIPALYQLHRKGRLPEGTRIVGVSRSPFSDDQWRAELNESTRQFVKSDFEESSWNEFARSIHYRAGDITEPNDFVQLETDLVEIEGSSKAERVYYLSTTPKLYEAAVTNLGAGGHSDQTNGPRRIVIEKPFGTDLSSAKKLNEVVHNVFQEDQVFRIDHYLGKETVQNLLVLRFANSIFEPIWNRTYVDHIQITVAEEVAIGSRAGYYETSGVLRDMFQNHLLQLLTITAMEAPAYYDARMVRDEKVKVLRAIREMSVEEIGEASVRGQYEGYLSEPNVPKESKTATFAALRLWIDNWRWHGVPFYLRSGKAMSCRTTQIVVQFRRPPHMLFGEDNQQQLDANRLVIQVQPAEGLQLHFLTKVPDSGMKLRMTDLNFRFDREFSGTMPDAYQRLLLDVANGDASLFARNDEVELAWNVIDPVLAAWNTSTAPPVEKYAVGDWGPTSCTKWMWDQGREWFDVCPVLH